MLVGLNGGKQLDTIPIAEPAESLSSKYDFDLQVTVSSHYNSCDTCFRLRIYVVFVLLTQYTYSYYVQVQIYL